MIRRFLHNTNNSDSILAIKVYTDANNLKEQILSDNSNKSGIYRWVNNISKNTYVGSAINLSKRLRSYYQKAELTKKNARPINQALLKYGYSNFSLEILEYCSKDNLLERENYYLDTLKPEYNILKYAYSLLGYKHTAKSIEKLKSKKISPEHKLLISLTHKNKIVNDETRAKLSAAIADFRAKNPLSEEKLANLRNKSIEREGVAVSVFNSQTNEVKEFTNQTEAGKFLDVSRQAIYNSIIRNVPIKKIYHISKKN
jgi:group I intron endonuclease